MVILARNKGTQPTSLASVSADTGISRRYLEQLVILLKNASLVRGTAGRKGGYLLARDADEITVGDVVRAASGPIRMSDCADLQNHCIRYDSCECWPIWTLLNRSVEEFLEQYTLEDLVDLDKVQTLRDQVLIPNIEMQEV